MDNKIIEIDKKLVGIIREEKCKVSEKEQLEV